MTPNKVRVEIVDPEGTPEMNPLKQSDSKIVLNKTNVQNSLIDTFKHSIFGENLIEGPCK